MLAEIGAGAVPEFFVFNKIDKLPDSQLPQSVQTFLDSLKSTDSGEGKAEKSTFAGSIEVSAKNPADVARVRQAIIDFFDRDLVETEIFVPYNRQELRGVLFETSDVKAERFDEQGIFFTVRIDKVALARLRASLTHPQQGS